MLVASQKRFDKTLDQRQAMFLAWCDVQTITHVMQVCKVGQGTVIKYRKADGWDQRLDKIKKKVTSRLDRKAADRTARNIDKIDALKEKVYNTLMGKHVEGLQLIVDKIGIKDLDKLIRLEELLLGKPDSRAEGVLGELDPRGRRAIIDFLETRGEETSA